MDGIRKLKKGLIKELFGWTLNDIDESDYYELCELFMDHPKKMTVADWVLRRRKGAGSWPKH